MEEWHPDRTPTLDLGQSEAAVLDRQAWSHKRRRTSSGDGLRQRAMDGRRHQAEDDDGERTDEGAGCRLCARDRRAEDDDGERTDEGAGCRLCARTEADLRLLLQENAALTAELGQLQLDESFFRDRGDRVRYYTGLPSPAALSSLFAAVQPLLPAAPQLTRFQTLVLALVRLRLDLPALHLSHLFSAAPQTLSAAFADAIDALHARLGPSGLWPGRRRLRAAAPPPFLRAFGKRAAVIVDCVEIRIESPSNVKARARSFSCYKATHTMKYLLGITPQGQICFVSKGWGGGASARRVLENCGLLKHLLPGDLLLAARGLHLRQGGGMMCAEVDAPALAGGRRRLRAEDEEATRAVAHLREHVERLTGSLHISYRFLHRRLPVGLLLPRPEDEFSLLDKVVGVCCVLTNMSPRPDETGGWEP